MGGDVEGRSDVRVEALAVAGGAQQLGGNVDCHDARHRGRPLRLDTNSLHGTHSSGHK